MFRSLTLLGIYVVLALPAAAIGIPWAWATGNIGLLYRWSMGIMRAGSRLTGLRLLVEGKENIPAQACIFMSNHVSNLDPPLLFPELPFRSAFFLKQSLMKIPILGMGMRMANFVPVYRDGRVESARQSVQFGVQVLASGVNITVFPEGTRSRDGRLLPFKKGPFFLAMESGAPVVPISIWGSERMMTKGSLRIRPGIAHLAFHPPIFPRDFETREQLTAAVRAAITSALPEAMWGLEKGRSNGA